ncbi:MAG: 50S ribosomal protein L37ae [Candidatus Woesearchaeota archaeon]
MVKEIKGKPSKRFGARYGLRIRKRVDEVERLSRKTYRCPYCGKIAVKRVAVGIWQCKSCNSKFTGYAYSVEEMKV